MTKKSMTSFTPMSSWNVEQLRLTAFPSPDYQITDPDWWSEVVSNAPERRESKPRTGQLIEEGEYGTGQLALIHQSGRIDWRYYALIDDPSRGVSEFPTLGSFSEALP